MSLTVERRIEGLLGDAERRGSCCVPGDRATRAAMRRRSGEVAEPIRGIFVRGEVWERLEPPDKMMHLMRAVTTLHPT